MEEIRAIGESRRGRDRIGCARETERGRKRESEKRKGKKRKWEREGRWKGEGTDKEEKEKAKGLVVDLGIGTSGIREVLEG